MSKRTITRWWIWGLAAFLPAGVLIPSSALALADHLQGGHGVAGDRYAITMVVLIVVAALFALISLAAQFVAWIGALVNTRRLPDSPWFTVLLWGGIVGIVLAPLFGLGGLIFASVLMAYLVAGPDATLANPHPTTPAKTTILTWAGRGFAIAGAGLAVALLTANLTGQGRPLHGLMWLSLAIVSAGISMIAVGAIVVSAAWWGALFNTHALPDRTWFNAVLWTGIAAMVVMPLFGLGALILAGLMIAYARSAPDGVVVSRPPIPAPSKPLVMH
jgi:hypothetical protein